MPDAVGLGSGAVRPQRGAGAEPLPAGGKLSLLHIFPTFAVGGAQVRFARLANHFGDAFHHRIVAMDGRTDARALLDPALAVDFPEIDTRTGSLPACVARFAAALRAWRPHRLVTSNWGSIDWAFARALTGTPHLHMEDGFGPEERDTQLTRRVLTRRAALRRSEIMLPSRVLLGLARDRWRLPARRLHHVPNGVDLRRFAPRPERPPPEVPVIGTVAALRPEKAVDRLLDAFARVRAERPARLVVVGDGPARAALSARAASLGIDADVSFAGHSDAPERCLADFDVFALSSDTEQMPLSVLEAMAAGLPVVSTDVGDVRWMLAPENDAYVVARDAEALGDALLALLGDARAMPAIGRANRQRTERDFDERAMFRAHGRLLGLPQT